MCPLDERLFYDMIGSPICQAMITNCKHTQLLTGFALTSLLAFASYAQQPATVPVEATSLSKSEASAPTTAVAIDPAKFDTLFASIKPAAAELRWLEIPWLGTLREGRGAAATAKKPMFFWAMNGHPLGTC
jgi:hypothetical protein